MNISTVTGKTPAVYLKVTQVELIDLINEEQRFSMLILGGNTDGESSGPLINHLTQKERQSAVSRLILCRVISYDEIDLLT